MSDEVTNEKATNQRKAYGLAMKRLREAHREEFNTFMAEEAKTLGVDWKPRPTEAEKAAAELDALLAAHPELRERLAPAEKDTMTVAEPPVAPPVQQGRPVADVPQA